MMGVTDFCNRFRPLGITLLRLAIGVIFVYHGWLKGQNLQANAHMFAGMGFPGWAGYGIAFLEIGGGVLLVLGVLTRLFGLLLAGEMLVAFLHVHLPSGPWWKVTGYELPMLLSAAAFWLFCYGGGPWSLDHRVFHRR